MSGRPPMPRWVVCWDSTEWPATGTPDLAAFAYTNGTGIDMAGIRETNASMKAWRDAAMAWCDGARYTFAEWLTARDAATGTSPDTCAAVALLEDGRAVCLPAVAVSEPEPVGGGG